MRWTNCTSPHCTLTRNTCQQGTRSPTASTSNGTTWSHSDRSTNTSMSRDCRSANKLITPKGSGTQVTPRKESTFLHLNRFEVTQACLDRVKVTRSRLSCRRPCLPDVTLTSFWAVFVLLLGTRKVSSKDHGNTSKVVLLMGSLLSIVKQSLVKITHSIMSGLKSANLMRLRMMLWLHSPHLLSRQLATQCPTLCTFWVLCLWCVGLVSESTSHLKCNQLLLQVRARTKPMTNSKIKNRTTD